MRFNKTIKLLEQEIFKPQPKENREKNKEKYQNIKIQHIVDEILSRATKNSNGSYDVEGNVNLVLLHLTKIPIKFNKVSGDFKCGANPLTSLENAPKEVTGYFICDGCELTTLKGGPKIVDGGFYCTSNNLTTLEGAPEKVGKNFDCTFNKLTSLEGAPKEVGRDFNCKNNPTKFKKREIRKICDVKGNIII